MVLGGGQGGASAGEGAETEAAPAPLVPFVVLSGTYEEREAAAVRAIGEVMRKASPSGAAVLARMEGLES
jgi:hypothetical protein